MKSIKNKINSLEYDELEKLKNYIKKKQLILKTNLDIPDLFVPHKKYAMSKSNYDVNNTYDDYHEIKSWCCFEFDNGMSITTNCWIDEGSHWFSDAMVNLSIKKNNITINYSVSSTFNDKIYCITLSLDKKSLKILDELKLDQNNFNKKMLGILLNNIIHESARICEKDDDYEMREIEYSKIKTLNTKKSLKNDKIMIYDHNNTIKIKYCNF
ncbi:hypothetical protein QLL95_gp1294 [Cotonvirus japonicus]|uniref:Uncharacterized protein n=1 Tax=Cotonvirus japonicus TaxID=2811091 RepID=A0ABM7NRQ5_9VIRU|nr:hypothetical protein QLL95_gp1294 [Cotonvirus japonicus]BCS82829.1 hypothetical protein [Cotonvirus japonicus]